MLATAVTVAVLVGLALGWSAERLLRRRDPGRRFAREFAALVTDTPIDWGRLHGPGPSVAATSYAAPAPRAEILSDRAKPLTADDIEYYAASWRNVRGQFVRYPASALRLAQHLTANLLLTRGLLPRDTAEATELPDAWTFSSARGYRQARAIAAQADGRMRGSASTITDTDLAHALSLFEDFYWEIVTLSPVG